MYFPLKNGENHEIKDEQQGQNTENPQNPQNSAKPKTLFEKRIEREQEFLNKEFIDWKKRISKINLKESSGLNQKNF